MKKPDVCEECSGQVPCREHKRCCICWERVLDNATQDDRWSWGPDGMHCHARCETEFRRRYM